MKAKIPKTDSISELAKFWDTHDSSKLLDQMELVKEPIFSDELILRVRLKAKEAKKVKVLAKSKGVKDTDLVREWIREKIKAS